MNVKPSVWARSMELRGFIASEFLKYHGPTDAEAGKTLTFLARKLGYSARTSNVLGRTLRSWSNGGAPQWAIKTMVWYILDQGFVPDTDEVLDVILAYLLVDLDSADTVVNNSILKNISNVELQASILRVIQ